jgi:hypothetical protein
VTKLSVSHCVFDRRFSQSLYCVLASRRAVCSTADACGVLTARDRAAANRAGTSADMTLHCCPRAHADSGKKRRQQLKRTSDQPTDQQSSWPRCRLGASDSNTAIGRARPACSSLVPRAAGPLHQLVDGTFVAVAAAPNTTYSMLRYPNLPRLYCRLPCMPQSSCLSQRDSSYRSHRSGAQFTAATKPGENAHRNAD